MTKRGESSAEWTARLRAALGQPSPRPAPAGPPAAPPPAAPDEPATVAAPPPAPAMAPPGALPAWPAPEPQLPIAAAPPVASSPPLAAEPPPPVRPLITAAPLRPAAGSDPGPIDPPQPDLPPLPAAMPAPARPATPPRPGPAAPSADPLGEAAVAAAYADLTGAALPPSARAAGADWVALSLSLGEAEGRWQALLLGAGNGLVPLTAVLAARKRGLVPVLHVTETTAPALAQLRTRLEARGLGDGETRLMQVAVGASPAAGASESRSLAELLAGAPRWDLVRVALRRTITPLLTSTEARLAEQMRWLVLHTHGRSEEAVVLRRLAAAGWKLAAERPSAIDLEQPQRVLRSGVQVWRSPLA